TAAGPGVLQQPARLHRHPDRLDRPGIGPDRQGPTDGRPPATGTTADILDSAGADPPAGGRGIPARPAGPRPPRPRRLPEGHRAPRPAHPTGAAAHRGAVTFHDDRFQAPMTGDLDVRWIHGSPRTIRSAT